MRPSIVMTQPDCYEVSYSINPWMHPDQWQRDPNSAKSLALRQWGALKDHLTQAGAEILTIPAAPGLPDLVFPANAAIVLDGKALLARFRYPERRGEEAVFHAYFSGLVQQGRLNSLHTFPDGLLQEGAGDCIWDAKRSLFWTGWGPRSDRRAMDQVVAVFGQRVVGLELITDTYYHLDTCFSVLPGGEILYYPEALSVPSRLVVEERVPEAKRIVATAAEAAAFSLNAVALGRTLYLSAPPPSLAAKQAAHGYECVPLDLSCFVMSGGGSFCMTLRLDLTSQATVTEARPQTGLSPVL